jgi:hypothetical protein
MRKDSSEMLLEWSEKIKKQKLSNKSENMWCREQGIPYTTYLYWKKKINQRNPPSPKKTEFIEIPEDPSLIEISLRGVKLTIAKNFDKSGLLYFLSLLKSE